jgi:hypothetical protein
MIIPSSPSCTHINDFDILLCHICWNIIISHGMVWNSKQCKMFWTPISSRPKNILCNQIYNNYNMQIWFAIEFTKNDLNNVKYIFHYNPPFLCFARTIVSSYHDIFCVKSSLSQAKGTFCLLIKKGSSILTFFFWVEYGLSHGMVLGLNIKCRLAKNLRVIYTYGQSHEKINNCF